MTLGLPQMGGESISAVLGIRQIISNVLNLKKKKMLPEFLLNPNPRKYLSDDYVVLDFETTNLDKGSALVQGNRIVLGTWVEGRGHPDARSAPGGNSVNCARSILELGRLVRSVENAGFIVAHNAKFELQWLQRLGVDTAKLLVYDTLLGEFVRLGNRRGDLSLDALLSRYGIPAKKGLVSRLIRGGVCPSEIPTRWLEEYGVWDTAATHKAFLKQRVELDSFQLLPVLFTRCLATVVLADMERKGVAPDPVAVEEEYWRVVQEAGVLERELAAQTGGINLNSPKQLGEFLYDKLGLPELVTRAGEPDRTEAGGRRTDSATIGKLHGNSDEQLKVLKLFREFGPLDKRREILTKLLECCKDGGILYAQFNQAVAQTHRLTSSGRKYKLQFQNFPRDYKRLFKARNEGWFVGEADGKQLEFRVAAHLGRDPVAALDIRSDFDVHRFTASNLLSIPLDRVKREQRQDAKPETFRPLYGGKGFDEPTRRYAKAFRERWKGIAKTQDGWTWEVLKHKQLRTESGLIFYWPDTKLTPSGYITNTTSIYNYPVQSFATAEIIPIALVYVWHRMREQGLLSFLVNTIHDSIIGEIHPDEVEQFKEIAKKSLTYDVFDYLKKVYNVKFTVPLGTEIKIGKNWGKGEETSFDLDPEKYFVI